METSPRDALLPVEQAVVSFFGYEILAVLLPDGRIAAMFSALCEALGLARHGQLQRIQRDDFLSEELLLVRVTTPGGPQDINMLTAWAIPTWLHGIQLS